MEKVSQLSISTSRPRLGALGSPRIRPKDISGACREMISILYLNTVNTIPQRYFLFHIFLANRPGTGPEQLCFVL